MIDQKDLSASVVTEPTKQKPIRLRWGALLIGIALIPMAGFWIFAGEMGGRVQRYTFATWAAPFYNAIYILLILSLLNLIVRKYLPKIALNKLELMAIYVMVSVGSGLMSSDMQGILVTLMGYPAHFANDTNNWNELFNGALPKWLMVNDKSVMREFYFGSSSLYTREHNMAWIRPIIPWTLFTWALLFMMLCVNTILRKAWVERERLTFPIVALPIAMTDEPEAFFKNKLMWLGFAIAGGITLMNGLHTLYPAVPLIPIKRQEFILTTGSPIDAISPFKISFYFFAITLGFLMPLDLSFSLYFFYILSRIEAVVVRTMGVPPGSGFPYLDAQSFGAYMAIFIAAVWGLKRHLKAVWQTAMSKDDTGEDASEPMRYRSAIIGFGIASMFLLAFAVAAGMKPIIALVFFSIYLALSVVITRIRAEFGFPVHDMHEMGPIQTLTRMFGSEAFDRQTQGVFTMFHWFNRVYRSHPMPHQLEGMKAAGNDGGAQRSMFRAMLIAGMIAVPVCFWVYLHGFYCWGAATAHVNSWGTGFGDEAFPRLDQWMKSPLAPESGQKVATVFAFAFTLLLTALRRQIVGFPFHPLAYAVSNSWGMLNLWMPIMIGSWFKAGTLRGLGLPGYRKAMMFFFGLMLGEFAIGCSWSLYGILFGVPTYDFWP